MPALDLGIYFPLRGLPMSTITTTCRNPSGFLNKIVASSPSGDFLCVQPWRIRLLFCEVAAGFLKKESETSQPILVGLKFALVLGISAVQVRVSKLVSGTYLQSSNCFMNIHPFGSLNGPGEVAP